MAQDRGGPEGGGAAGAHLAPGARLAPGWRPARPVGGWAAPAGAGGRGVRPSSRWVPREVAWPPSFFVV